MNRTAIIIAAMLSTASVVSANDATMYSGSHCYGCNPDGSMPFSALNPLHIETPIVPPACTVWHVLDTAHEERGENWKPELTFADCAKAAANADSHNAIRYPHTLWVVKPESWEPPKANARLHVEQGIINFQNSDPGAFLWSQSVTVPLDDFFRVEIPSRRDTLHGYIPSEGDVVEWYVRGADCAEPTKACRFGLAIRKRESAK